MRVAHEVKQAAAGGKIPFLRMGKNGTQDLLWVVALQILPRPHVARRRSQEMESYPMKVKAVRFVRRCFYHVQPLSIKLTYAQAWPAF
jgi:hypothetical protein